MFLCFYPEQLIHVYEIILVASLPGKTEIIVYGGVQKHLLPITQISVCIQINANLDIFLTKLVKSDLSWREYLIQSLQEQNHFGHLPNADGPSLLGVDLLKTLREEMLGYEISKPAILLDVELLDLNFNILQVKQFLSAISVSFAAGL